MPIEKGKRKGKLEGERLGIQKGEQKGIQKGKLDEKAEVILTLFYSTPQWLDQKYRLLS
jgi:flagellar biosynthesis/type III secretory pathway protein FliH